MLHYIKITINYVKYIVQDMKNQQLIKDRTTSINRLYTNIESANWLLDRDKATVETWPKERKGISLEAFGTNDRHEFKVIYHFEKDKRYI